MDIGRNQKKELAEALYMAGDKSQKEICEIVGWSENTFCTNKAKYGWEEKRGILAMGAHEIIQNIMLSIGKLAKDDAIKNHKEIRMLTSSIISLRGERLTVMNYIDVFKEFTSFLLQREPKLAQAINKHQNAFVEQKMKEGVK